MITARTAVTGRTLFALALCACAHAAPEHHVAEPRQPAAVSMSAQAPEPHRPLSVPVAELAKLDLAARFGAYIARDAAWTAGQPLAVNRDFDFFLAMSMDMGGPGLAAKRRRDMNEALAQELAALPNLDSNELMHALCDAPPRTLCNELVGKPVGIYGLLWGDKDARLQVVVEAFESASRFAVHASVSKARPVSAFLQPGALARAFREGLAVLATAVDSAAGPSTAVGACRLTPGAKLSGLVVARTPAFTLLALDTPTAPRVLCPSDAFEAAAPE